MKANFNDVFNSKQFLGYIEEVRPELGVDNQLAALFPLKKIPGLEYSYLKGAKGPVELSSPSAFDAEPINQNRTGFDAMKGELPLFRKKMVLSEKEKYMLDLYLKGGEDAAVKSLLANIYDDQKALVEGSLMTMEYLRARALFDGKVNIVSKGGAVVVDYGVPAANKKVLTGTAKWDNSAAKIIDNVREWIDAIEEKTGVRPDTMMMNKRTLKHLLKNAELKDLAQSLAFKMPATGFNMFLPDEFFVNAFKAATGLMDVIIYNKKVKLDGAVKDLVEDNKVALFAKGKLGEMLVGSSPAELAAGRAAAAGGQISVTGDGIAINVLSNERAPYTTSTECEFIGLPSLPVADQIVIATVA